MVGYQKVTLSLLNIGVLCLLFCCGSQKPLVENYHTSAIGVDSYLRLDTSLQRFEYGYVAGLINDTITGEYDHVGNSIVLKPYKSTVEVTDPQSGIGFSVDVVDGRTKGRMSKYVVEKFQSDTVVFVLPTNMSIGDTVQFSYPGYDTSERIVLENLGYKVQLFRTFGVSNFLTLKKSNGNLINEEIVLFAQ